LALFHLETLRINGIVVIQKIGVHWIETSSAKHSSIVLDQQIMMIHQKHCLVLDKRQQLMLTKRHPKNYPTR
jgi:hypothetical protein